MVGHHREDVVLRVSGHFQKVHDKYPRPNPRFLDMSDFEPNTVYLSNDSGSRHPFESRLFSSREYYIAEVTEEDYVSCLRSRRNQESLSAQLSRYFPVI